MLPIGTTDEKHLLSFPTVTLSFLNVSSIPLYLLALHLLGKFPAPDVFKIEFINFMPWNLSFKLFLLCLCVFNFHLLSSVQHLISLHRILPQS